MKRIFVLILIAVIVLSCIGCNKTVPGTTNDISDSTQQSKEQNKALPTEKVIDEHTLVDEFVKKAQVEFDIKNAEDYSLLYGETIRYLEQEFHRVYDPYYDIQSLDISGWIEEENEATFSYKMTYLHYNRDPDTVEYIKESKNKSQESYEKLYNDYLALHETNYRLKIVLDGENLKLYTDISPYGAEWKETKIDNFIVGQ